MCSLLFTPVYRRPLNIPSESVDLNMTRMIHGRGNWERTIKPVSRDALRQCRSVLNFSALDYIFQAATASGATTSISLPDDDSALKSQVRCACTRVQPCSIDVCQRSRCSPAEESRRCSHNLCQADCYGQGKERATEGYAS